MKPEIFTIFIHHSAYPNDKFPQQFEIINIQHKKQFGLLSKLGFYGGYTYLIEPNGELKQYREEGEEQTAQKGFNVKSCSICLAGDFSVGYPSLAQERALKRILARLMADYKLDRDDIMLHRDIKETACPGKNIDQKYLDQILKQGLVDLLRELYNKLVGLTRSKQV